MLSRRRFLASAAAAAPASATPLSDKISPRALPFPLKQVKLLDPTLRAAAEKNREYLHSLEPDRLLHMFRVTAGLPSTAEPLGGWESPNVEVRGHFMGHYLSGCALMAASSGDEKIRSKADALVAELDKCQKKMGNGYLSAFPTEEFDRLREGKKVWVPWYTYHKLLAGLLDVHTLCGNRQALDVAARAADWAQKWTDPLSSDHIQRILEVEHGGMLEALVNLAAATGESRYLRLSHRFDHAKFFDPLAARRDELKGLHVNTQIPKVVGAARRYELTGDERDRAIADFFWRQVTGHRAYCTGGVSNREKWLSDPDRLASELSATTQECCCTYNMLKLTRHLLGWSADARLADYYERAFYNGIVGTINPTDGLTMYYVPLASGYWKIWGRPRTSFWCCTGTGVESFSKLADSIYFHDDRGIFVNLFVASHVNWAEKGVAIRQETTFPEEARTRFIFATTKPLRLALRVRVPYWTHGMTAAVNGSPMPGAPSAGSYWTIDRTWKNGDVITVEIPMHLHSHPMPDNPGMQAILYGPLVLAGDLGNEGMTDAQMHGDPNQQVASHYLVGKPVAVPDLRASGPIGNWIQPVQGRPLTFRTRGQSQDVTLIPLNRIFDQRYAVYWNVAGSGSA